MESQESLQSKDDVRSRLQDFGYYFIESFEEQLQFFRSILEERPNAGAKATSLPVTVTSGLAAAIPTFGKSLSTGIQQGERYVVKKIDKKRALTLAEIVYFHGNVREVLRDILLRGVFDLLYCFEMQFMHVNANGGSTRAMQKLATDASHRLVIYLLDNYEGGEITPDTVVKGVLKGESKRHKLGIVKSGRSLMLEGGEDTVTTLCLYTRVGMCLRNEENLTFYKSKETKTDLIGHRLLFHWENPADIENEWDIDDVEISYKYQLHNDDRDEDVENIRKYIVKKYPLEDIKEFNKVNFDEQIRLQNEASLQRQENQTEIIEDNKVKHEETIHTMTHVQTVILETLKTNQEELLRHTDEKFSEVNENVNDKHAEVVGDLVTIRHELCETKGNISTTEDKLAKETEELKQDVLVLKEHKAELDENIVLKINRNEVKKVEETLKKLDPIRAITNSGDFKKLKKRFKF